MALLKDTREGANRAALAAAEPHDFDGSWQEGNNGVFEMRFCATEAGAMKLHVWCDPLSKGDRIPFPNSPFALHVSPGQASTRVSQVDGWTKLLKEEKNVKYGKGAQADINTLIAGDTLTIRPEIYDDYGNSTVVPEGLLQVRHEFPNGDASMLKYTTQMRGGMTQYDIKHDTSVSGDHKIHIEVTGEPIQGSPVTFSVLPDRPDPEKSRLCSPTESMLYTDVPAVSVLRSHDKYGNACMTGGHKFGTRLQLVKQSVHDQTALVPQNHTIEVEDQQDGTYRILVTLTFSCAVKLFVNMDKNLPGGAGELPPVNMLFHKSGTDASSTLAADIFDEEDKIDPVGSMATVTAAGGSGGSATGSGGVQRRVSQIAEGAQPNDSLPADSSASQFSGGGSGRAVDATGSSGAASGTSSWRANSSGGGSDRKAKGSRSLTTPKSVPVGAKSSAGSSVRSKAKRP